jgi:hypothetical protein
MHDNETLGSIKSRDIFGWATVRFSWLFLALLIARYQYITCALIHIVFQSNFNNTSADNLNISSPTAALIPGRNKQTYQCQQSILLREYSCYSDIIFICIRLFITSKINISNKHVHIWTGCSFMSLFYRFVRWYINITITILDIIHRPVFYLKLNSTL